MARDTDWQAQGRNSLQNFANDTRSDLTDHVDSVLMAVDDLRGISEAPDPDPEEVRVRAEETRDLLRDLGVTAYDLAGDASRTASNIPRLLRGNEPVGYSTPDGGAKADVHYGGQAVNRMMRQTVMWPLQIGTDDDWVKRTPERPDPRAIGCEDDIPTVTAEGTRMYTRSVPGATVHVVLDTRGHGPL